MMKLTNPTQVKDLIQQANCIAVTTHMSPDGDAIGSLLAFSQAVKHMGKSVFMVVDDKIPEKYNIFAGYDEIHRADEADLPTPDLLVVLDCGNLGRVGRVGTRWQVLTLNIDHHDANDGFADYVYLLPEYAATGEMIAELFYEWDLPVTAEMASALYLAIATDCGFFRFNNTSVNTMKMATFCVEKGANIQAVARMADMFTKPRFEAIKDALQTVEFYQNGYVAVMCLSHEVMEMIDHDDDGFVDYIRNVEGVEIAALLKEKVPGITKFSLRSRDVNVNEIARTFDGGGHIYAAGCTIDKPLSEAKVMFIQRLQEMNLIEK